MDRALAVKAAGTQAVAVAVLSIALAIALPHSFFDDWGWVAGPGAWALCALVTARVLNLPPGRTLLGAAVAGVPSLIGVLLGAHWLGAVLAIGVFAAWCGSAASQPRHEEDVFAIAPPAVRGPHQ